MNKSTLGVAKINDNEILGMPTDKPQGFIVREKLINGKAVSLEFGAYLSPEIFLGVPVHVSMKKNLIASQGTPEYNYYLVPQLMQFAVGTYTGKKTGKLNPILIAPNDNTPAAFISCLTVGDNMNKVLNVELDGNSSVIRKYIDKDRNMIGLIVMNNNFESINPTTRIKVELGVPGTKSIKTVNYTFNPVEYPNIGFTSSTDINATDEPVQTAFINLANFIEPQPTEKKSKINKQNNQ